MIQSTRWQIVAVAAAVASLGPLGCPVQSLVRGDAPSRITMPSQAPVQSASVQSPVQDVELIGRLEIPGTFVDLSGFNNVLKDGSPANRFGGLSAIEYSGNRNRFYLLADRGAGDGAVAFPCRYHIADLIVSDDNTIAFELQQTVMLRHPDGTVLDGSLESHGKDQSSGDGHQFTAADPEGIRRWEDGSLIISDEYGPRVFVVGKEGIIQQTWYPGASLRLPLEPTNAAIGSFTNRGFEGIAVTKKKSSPRRVWVTSQSALIQDGQFIDGKCLGPFVRWSVFNTKGQLKRQVAYPLASQKSGLSEILPIGRGRFLTIERDGKTKCEAQVKRIVIADTNSATNIRREPSLATADPSKFRPVVTQVLIDLLDPCWDIAIDDIPEKPEGICWGPKLPDGRDTLWLACDNDFDPQRTTKLFCFAIDRRKI